MASPRFQQIAIPRTGHRDTDRALAETSRLLNTVLDAPLSRARVMTVTLIVGLNRVSHGLGRVPIGFLATPHSTGTTHAIADARTTNAHTSSLLHVHSATATDATLVVF